MEVLSNRERERELKNPVNSLFANAASILDPI